MVSIARRHGIPLDALRKVNPDVEPLRIWVGTVLAIPHSAGTVAGGSRISTNPPQIRFAGIRPR